MEIFNSEVKRKVKLSIPSLSSLSLPTHSLRVGSQCVCVGVCGCVGVCVCVCFSKMISYVLCVVYPAQGCSTEVSVKLECVCV